MYNNNKARYKKGRFELREIGKRKYERFVSKFESLALRPRFHRNERFLLSPQRNLTKDTIFNSLFKRRVLNQWSST